MSRHGKGGLKDELGWSWPDPPYPQTPPTNPPIPPPYPPTLRTTVQLVGGIVTINPNIDATPFLYIANSLTTNVCGGFNYNDSGVNSTMELIERWLSAHFYTVYDNQWARVKAGLADTTFQHKVDMGLAGTMFGQQAMRIDYRLGLAKLDNSAKVVKQIRLHIGWLGERNRWRGDVDFGWMLSVEQ